MNREQITEAIGRAYAYPENAGKSIDHDLANAIVEEIDRLTDLRCALSASPEIKCMVCFEHADFIIHGASFCMKHAKKSPVRKVT